MRVASIDGLPVFNAKKPIKLKITKRDIGIADPKKPDHCAAAVACKRELHAKEVRVHLGRIYVRTNNTNWQRYSVPRNMRTEIIAFDRGGSFEPGEFMLGAPQERPSHQGGPEAPGARDKRRPHSKKIVPKMVVQNVRTGPAAAY